MVGSDNVLSMPLPTEMHLPLTELQKQAEELEYSELLDKVLIQCFTYILNILLPDLFISCSGRHYLGGIAIHIT